MPTRILSLIVAAVLVPAALASAQPTAAGTRLKDIAGLQAAGSTPVIGYGLVIGLQKTGDRQQTVFSVQTLLNMLQRFGVTIPPAQMAQIKVENVAAVLVTADMPSYARSGSRLDVTASSIGDARSLQGGTLLPTPMRGPDGQVRALAQGSLTLGGFGGGTPGNSVAVNHLTVGRVPGGALVQIGTGVPMGAADSISFTLKDPDFMSAGRVAHAINAELGTGTARAVDPATVMVKVPAEYHDALPDLIARLEPLSVDVDAVARVVINERTGTVVVGGAVRIGSAAVAHGNLSVRITTKLDVSQPPPLSGGQTKVVPDTNVDVAEARNQLVTLPEGTTLEAVVHALNALGASPRDVIAIMQALKAAGALRAELVVL